MVDFQQRKDKDLLLHTHLDFVVTVSTSFQIKPYPLQVCKTLKSTYFHLPDTIKKQFSFFPLLKKFTCHVESKNANELNNAAEKNCVHMYQYFLTWVFRFAPMLGGYLILLLTVGSNFWTISEAENHWFWFFWTSKNWWVLVKNQWFYGWLLDFFEICWEPRLYIRSSSLIFWEP